MDLFTAHLLVEVFGEDQVEKAQNRLEAGGIAGPVQKETTCCYAKADKVWSNDPQGLRWEWYRVVDDSDTFGAPPEFDADAERDAGRFGSDVS